MLIQLSIHRPNGSIIEMADGTKYTFKPTERNSLDHVCDVQNVEHAELLLSIDGYTVYGAASAATYKASKARAQAAKLRDQAIAAAEVLKQAQEDADEAAENAEAEEDRLAEEAATEKARKNAEAARIKKAEDALNDAKTGGNNKGEAEKKAPANVEPKAPVAPAPVATPKSPAEKAAARKGSK